MRTAVSVARILRVRIDREDPQDGVPRRGECLPSLDILPIGLRRTGDPILHVAFLGRRA